MYSPSEMPGTMRETMPVTVRFICALGTSRSCSLTAKPMLPVKSSETSISAVRSAPTRTVTLVRSPGRSLQFASGSASHSPRVAENASAFGAEAIMQP